jgi:prephenate dehydrogenase
MKTLAESQVVIVGLGLMGGSLAGALCGQCRAVIGVDRSAEALEIAMARGWIKWGTTDWEASIQDADVVVLATPVRVILRLLDKMVALPRKSDRGDDVVSELARVSCPDCLLMDVGSTKAQITRAMAKLPPQVQPLGAHPMCGKEVAGIEAAEASLYQGQTFVLTPLPRTSQDALALGKVVVEAVGAQPLLLEPQRHDQLVATASHLPYLLACALVGTAEATDPVHLAGKLGRHDPTQAAAEDGATVWDVVASGFRDTSRLAASDVTMMLDILLTNREPVLDAIRACQLEIHQFADMLRAEDEQGLREALMAVQRRRKELFI